MEKFLKFLNFERYYKNGKFFKILKLQKVFKKFPTTPINLDVKEVSEELIIKTHELITEFERQKITVWGSFIKKNTDRLYKLNPEIPFFFSLKDAVRMYIKYLFGILPFVQIPQSYLEIPFITPEILTYVSFFRNRSQSFREKFAFFMNYYILFAKPLVNHLNGRGIRVFVWVLNEKEEFETALKYPINGIMTDRCKNLRDFLDEKNVISKDLSF